MKTLFVGALGLVAAAGCHRSREAHGSTPPPSPAATVAAPSAAPARVLSHWKGRVDALGMNVGILWFSPSAAFGSAALQVEAERMLHDNDAFAREAPPADLVIVKATVSVGSPDALHFSRTESFVFERGSGGAWGYTEKYDRQLMRLRL